jgi:hypothetical protein
LRRIWVGRGDAEIRGRETLDDDIKSVLYLLICRDDRGRFLFPDLIAIGDDETVLADHRPLGLDGQARSRVDDEAEAEPVGHHVRN